MTTYSKILPYSCYELGHCWEPSCARSSFEICIISFIESCQIYGVVYLLTGLIQLRQMTLESGKKLLKDYLRSSCFLCLNGCCYIGTFCVLRHLLRHINFVTASFMPGFLASVIAILVERPERRPLLAIYVTNVATESLWNTAVEYGYARNIPRGEILIFVGTMMVLGYYYRSSKPLSKMINTALQFFFGHNESGRMIDSRNVSPAPEPISSRPSHLTWVQRLLAVFTKKHSRCPHKKGCVPHFLGTALWGFSQGFLFQLCLKVLPSIPHLIRSPGKLLPLVRSKGNVNAGLFVAWFSAFFKGTCCVGRWWHGKDKPSHGVLAGALAGLAMYFYSAPTIALYLMWKTFEGLYKKGCDAGYLPQIPGSVEFLYCLSTGYLFHTAVIDCRNLKPSYKHFLGRLTWERMFQYNRHLLDGYGFESGIGFEHYWPPYQQELLSDYVRKRTADFLKSKNI
ncbi:hypothetical protein SK128_017091 [Halocaridina rubra]|uniref:Transmembrane protein 135 N-terminal domain-containing protein n=1 Tax=Halocaridina rubra TaxID=373956 RepID=A0AAN8XRE0_HALRR